MARDDVFDNVDWSVKASFSYVSGQTAKSASPTVTPMKTDLDIFIDLNLIGYFADSV